MPTIRRSARRGAYTLLAAPLLLALSALPASAHPSFRSYASLGLGPNTLGSSGLNGASLPYPSATRETFYLDMADEQTVAYNGSDDTAVDAKIFLPTGFTDPVCGPAELRSMETIQGATVYAGNGAAVPGWTCSIHRATASTGGQPGGVGVGLEAGQLYLEWKGPQVTGIGVTLAKAAETYVFSATTPSETSTIAFDGSDGVYAHAFEADEVYASGFTRNWFPNQKLFWSNYPTTAAGGLIRYVGTTPLPVPASPTHVVAFARKVSALVRWQPPVASTTATITKYVVRSRDITDPSAPVHTCSVTIAAPQTIELDHCTVTHLRAGDDYEFDVFAHNRTGTGSPTGSNSVAPMR
jgi:Fibronectin type III domain